MMVMAQQPPQTGNLMIDEALAKVANMDDLDLSQQLELLTEVESVLQQVLRTSRQAAQAAALEDVTAAEEDLVSDHDA